MDVVEALQTLINANYKEAIYGIAIIIVALVVLKKLYNEIIELFHIETPTMKKERERREEIKSIQAEIQSIKQGQDELHKKSDETDESINNQINNLNNMIKSLTIASMRSTLWRIYSESIEQQYITREGLKTFLECGKVYEEAGGDDIYHSKLYPEVMALHIHEQGEDNDEQRI